MLKREIYKLKEPLEFDIETKVFDGYETHSPLIKKYNNVKIKGELFYDKPNNLIEIMGTIDYSLDAIDARDGKNIVHQEKFDWNDEYSLDETSVEDLNIIVGEEVDLMFLAIEQINANIPMNLTHNNGIISKTGSGWELLSEEEYEHQKTEKPDPRWDKLKEFKINHKD